MAAAAAAASAAAGIGFSLQMLTGHFGMSLLPCEVLHRRKKSPAGTRPVWPQHNGDRCGPLWLNEQSINKARAAGSIISGSVQSMALWQFQGLKFPLVKLILKMCKAVNSKAKASKSISSHFQAAIKDLLAQQYCLIVMWWSPQASGFLCPAGKLGSFVTVQISRQVFCKSLFMHFCSLQQQYLCQITARPQNEWIGQRSAYLSTAVLELFHFSSPAVMTRWGCGRTLSIVSTSPPACLSFYLSVPRNRESI